MNFQDLESNINKADIVCIDETWYTKNQEYLIPEENEIVQCQGIKRAERGKASGGILITYNKYIYNKVEIFKIDECFIILKFIITNSVVFVCVVYVNQTSNFVDKLSNLSDFIQIIKNKYSDAKIIIGGDFNARFREKNVINADEKINDINLGFKRSSYDKNINKRGKELE